MSNITENFKYEELVSRPSLCLKITPLLYHHMDLLQKLRDIVGAISINSAYRTDENNSRVGGVDNSMHLEFATDLRPHSVGLDALNKEAERLGFSGIGRYKTFLHVDCRAFLGRDNARWDSR
tara:strand:- start:384 stop:749 length:366 start_codon:yes stop_codon:yes gene_type:complete